MRIRSLFALAVVLAIPGTACDVRVNDNGGVSLDINEGGRAEAESTETYPLTKGGRIEVQTENGDIELTPARGADAQVRYRRRARAKNDEEAKQLLNRQYVTVEAKPDLLSIRSVKEEGVEGFRNRVRIDYYISVPAGSMVSVKNENGGVTLNDVTGRFTVGSTNSRINGKGVSGGLDIETVNGGVIMDMAAVTSDVRISTVNGGVVLTLPDSTNATLEAATVNGGVSVNDTLRFVPTTKDRQRVTGRIGTGTGPRIDLRTTNGGVRLGGVERPK